MTNREKIIEGLGLLNNRLLAAAKRDAIAMLDASMVADAIAMLKEQEAVPVIQREIAHMLFWCCGSCGVAITDGDKFCRNCGRAVKWNNEIDKEVKTNGA